MAEKSIGVKRLVLILSISAAITAFIYAGKIHPDFSTAKLRGL